MEIILGINACTFAVDQCSSQIEKHAPMSASLAERIGNTGCVEDAKITTQLVGMHFSLGGFHRNIVLLVVIFKQSGNHIT